MRFLTFSLGLLLQTMSLLAQPTVGLIQHEQASFDEGYVLFSPTASKNTYLIDKCGRLVKTWTSLYNPALSVYLLEDGNLLRTGKAGNTTFPAGGNGGVIEKIDWNGNVVWSYTLSDNTQCQHHDVKQMSNGHVLVISWELKTAAEAIAKGRNPALTGTSVWSEKIVELEPIGSNQANIVWEWHAWDHLVQDFDATKDNFGVVLENPQLLNANYRALLTTEDWLHLNSVDYNENLDQIVLSSHSFSEIWIIDHSTTTEEAAGHSGGNSGKGGDLLYRWGNPAAYNFVGATRQFWGQHNAYWIPEGMPFENQLMVFNNGNGRMGGNYSTVEIINPPVEGFTYNQNLPFGPAAQSWMYNAGNTAGFYAQNISGSQQLSNGNVLMCEGPAGRFLEVDTDGSVVWEYINPVGNTGPVSQGSTPLANTSFRCTFYASDFGGFENYELQAGPTIENTNSVSSNCSIVLANEVASAENGLLVYPNPAEDAFTIEGLKYKEVATMHLVTAQGQLVYSTELSPNTASFTLITQHLNSGVYFIRLQTKSDMQTLKVIVN